MLTAGTVFTDELHIALMPSTTDLLRLTGSTTITKEDTIQAWCIISDPTTGEFDEAAGTPNYA